MGEQSGFRLREFYVDEVGLHFVLETELEAQRFYLKALADNRLVTLDGAKVTNLFRTTTKPE